LTALCAAIVASTAFNHLIFYFDKFGKYHRGRLIWLPMSLQFLMMMAIEGFIIIERKKIEESYFRSLLFFLMIPMIGWVLQLFIFGLPFSLISAAFAAQVVFTNIQNRSMDTDYLTGVFNRQSLDNYMQHKISTASKERSFSAILLDLDNFKSINDAFGHVEGDRALIDTAGLLKNALTSKDFIARYGGDEFCIILEEGDRYSLEKAISRINSCRLAFNENRQRSYQISFSIGSAVFDPDNRDTLELFLRKLDQKMYEEKRTHKNKMAEAEIGGQIKITGLTGNRN
jgi:diguanylate cyclase (GGDEF)-like protein